MNDTKEKVEKAVLVSEIVKVVEKCETLYSEKRVYQRVMGVVMAELMAFGRHTITQLLLVLGNTEDDWSAWYRVFSQKRSGEWLQSCHPLALFERLYRQSCKK